ncbi:MAG: hypothetical protein RLZZ613_335 [Pseudomonadota bacterium]
MRLTRIGSESAMANISALNETSLSELSPALERGDISSREIVEQCLAAIQARDPKLHAFVKLDAESALALADAADQQRRQGYERGPSNADKATRGALCTACQWFSRI